MHYQLTINTSTHNEHLYENLYAQIDVIFCQRAEVVNGLYEPTDEECLNPWRDDNEDEELARAVQGAAITEGEKKEGEETKPTE